MLNYFCEQQVCNNPSTRYAGKFVKSVRGAPGLRDFGRRLEVSDAVGGLEPSRCYIIRGDSVSTC